MKCNLFKWWSMKEVSYIFSISEGKKDMPARNTVSSTLTARAWLHTYVVCILFECLFFLYDWITLVLKCAWPLYLANGTFNLISKISSQVRCGLRSCFAFRHTRSAGRTAIFLDSSQGWRFSIIVCGVSPDPLHPAWVDAYTPNKVLSF